MSWNRRVVPVLMSVLATSGWTLGQAKARKPAAPTSGPAFKATAERIRQWVRDMDDDSSRVRDQAVANLTRAGKAAVGPVAEAAKGKSLEVTFRAMTVLRALLASKDAAASSAAKSALKKLAAGGEHESARQARAILEAAEPRAQPARGRIAGRANVARANPMANIALRLWVVELGGTLNVTVVEKGSQVQIREMQNQITVTVTDKIGAQGKHKQYKAANAAELKKKHPEAYKLYEKYVGKGKGKALVAEKVAAVRAAALIAEAQKELARSLAALKAGQAGKSDPKQVQELLRRIDAANKKLAEARKKLTE